MRTPLLFLVCFLGATSCFAEDSPFAGKPLSFYFAGRPLSFYRAYPGGLQCSVTVLLLSEIHKGIVNYTNDYDRIPEGSLSDILNVISGKDKTGRRDPSKAGYLDINVSSPKAIYLDAAGHLLDGWGTPFIMQRDKQTGAVTIISCGPNGVLNQTPEDKARDTSDDIHVTIPTSTP